MRLKQDRQGRFDFHRSSLRVTSEHYDRYRAISAMLDGTPAIVGLVHKEIAPTLEAVNRRTHRRGRPCRFTTDNVVRLLICQVIEGLSLREIVVRVDDSHALRWFTRIYDGPMMDYTTLCRLRNAIGDETWKKVNYALAKAAVAAALIGGDRLRLDTTLVETNIRWPSDSGLLWDTYRVLCRLIRKGRDVSSGIAEDRRLQEKRVKKIQLAIARETAKRKRKDGRVKRLYTALVGHGEAILEVAVEAAHCLGTTAADERAGITRQSMAQALSNQMLKFVELGRRVIDQTRRRVMLGESVPSTEKVYSIFEPQTELIKRGKAGKEIEFGHMVSLAQVEQKFITNYQVFARRPVEPDLLAPAVKHHCRIFGRAPAELSADKGYHRTSAVTQLAETVDLVAIGRPRGRAASEDDRVEPSELFKLAQMFRAGIEGSISFLKRAFRMFRCFDRGWAHYAANVGRIVFGHNLVVLARLRST